MKSTNHKDKIYNEKYIEGDSQEWKSKKSRGILYVSDKFKENIFMSRELI